MPRVVLNLSDVRYIDSSGVALLVEGLKASRDLGSCFMLFGSNDTNMPMCTIAGLFTPAEMQSLAFAFEGSRGIKMKVSERCGRTQRTASAALSASVGGLDGNSFAESQQ